jgi:predicted Zn-dependent protease
MRLKIWGTLVLAAAVLFSAGFQLPNLPVPLPVPSAPVPVPSEAGKAISVGTKAAQKTMVAAKGISDSEEYYIGRAVAARLMARNSLSQNQDATTYINEVGQAVAKKSSMPRTYRGYHFGILETSDANAYACPGGIILITRGLIKECQNEDELAAVLAHEVAHIAHKDGIKSINKARWGGRQPGEHVREFHRRRFQDPGGERLQPGRRGKRRPGGRDHAHPGRL